MQFPKWSSTNSEENILPLTNVVFLLLIFFMLAGSLQVFEVLEVQAPETQGQAEAPNKAWQILINQQGRLALNNALLSETELLGQVKTALKNQPQLPIVLKADARLPANHLVRFSQTLYQVGVKKLRLQTLAELP